MATPSLPVVEFTNHGVCSQTAAEFQKLAALRGISSDAHWDKELQAYVANGVNCGPSVHGLYDWLNAQPGVQP